MMWLYVVIGLVVGAIGAFIAGMLVWRNNAKKFETIMSQAKKRGQAAESFIKDLLP